METGMAESAPPHLVSLYSLEKLIEWKHGIVLLGLKFTRTLYSLEKLTEWKLEEKGASGPSLSTLYSLEKLIEWKPPL